MFFSCLFWNDLTVRSFRVGLASKQEDKPNTNNTNMILFISNLFCGLKIAPRFTAGLSV